MRDPYKIIAEFPDELFTFLYDYEVEKNAANQRAAQELQDLSQLEHGEAEQLESWHNSTVREVNDRATRQRAQYDATANVRNSDAEKRRAQKLAEVQNIENRLEEMHAEFDSKIIACAKDINYTEYVIPVSSAIEQLKEESQNLPAKAEDYNAPVLALKEEEEAAYQRIRQRLSRMREEADQEFNTFTAENSSAHRKNVNDNSARQQQELNAHARAYSQRSEKQQQNSAQRRADLMKQIDDRKAALEEKFRQQFVEVLKPEQVKQAYDELIRSEAQYKGYVPAKHNGAGLLFGQSRSDLTHYMEDDLIRECVEQHFSYALGHTGNSTWLDLPCGVAFTDKKFSSMIAYPKELRDTVVSNLNAMAMQLFMTNMAGKVRFTFISPSDAGEAFASFMRFTDVDERLVDTHVWVDAQRIEERLDVLLNRAQTISQDYLRGQYADILEYNRAAGKNAESLQFLMVVDFPRGFTQAALEKLENVMSNGPKNGIYTILAGEYNEISGNNTANDPRYNVILQRIIQKLSVYRYENGALYTPVWLSESIPQDHAHKPPQAQYLPLQLPEQRTELDDVIETLKKAAYNADHVVITYDDVMEDLPEHPERWFRYSDERGISMPFALAGANKTLSLDLASDPLSPKYHTLITGMIGSGKSTLLHTLIMGMLMKYSPEDVQIYLMDFKDGVEFKIYTEYDLKNFRAISIDTEPEFGLAVLKKIEAEMQRRNNIFKQDGCRNLEGYREKVAENGELHHGMPRTVLIIDEFQEAFARSDDPVMSEAAEIIKRLTLVGRAPAIYLIMATQDIKNAAALQETVYNQFETRIALKSSPDSARIVLPDNPMAEQLINLDKGVAVFNASAGNKDHNVQCRIAYCSESEQRSLLEQIAKKQAAAGFKVEGGTRLLLSSIQDDRSNPLTRFEKTGELDQDYMGLGYRLFVGEPLSLENDFHPELYSRKGQNMLLVGTDQQRARVTTAFMMVSVLYEAIRQQEVSKEPLITLFDLSTDVAQDDMFGKLVHTLQDQIRVYHASDVLDGVETLEKELPKNRRQFVVFFGLNRARRLLVQPDAYTKAPRERLVSLLQNGPENNMNFIVWVNSVDNFLELYKDALPCFDQRLVGDIPAEQFQPLILAAAPANMKPKNAVYFDMDGAANPKIRLYEQPTEEWTKKLLENLQSSLKEAPENDLW